MSGAADRAYAALVERQRARNARDADDRQLFAPHRRRLHALIEQALPAGGRLCVLGAGNANDLELPALAARAAEVHLVDLDPAALARAVSRLSAEVRPRVVTRAPIDLAGGLLQLAVGWRTRPPTPAALADAVGPAATRAAAEISDQFDVVVSDCVLSQMCLAAAEAVGPHGPVAEDVCRALGRAHLRTMTRLARPGGAAVLATDVTSSAILPALDGWEAGDLGDVAGLMRDAVEARRHSVGMNPFLLRRAFREDDELRGAVDGLPALHEPWLWRVSTDDVFLVVGMTWRKGP